MNDALKRYVKRKVGQGQRPAWIIKSYLPSLLIVFIMVVLVFALIFVSSMSKAIEDTLVYLGCGNLLSNSYIDSSSLNSDERAFSVTNASAIVASQDSTALVQVKGVTEDYYFDKKVEVLNLTTVDNPTTLNSVYLSKTIASSLNVTLGDRVSVLIFDEEEERARPVFCFVGGLYHSGYGEFDSHLIFAPFDMVDGVITYELYTPRSDELRGILEQNGITVSSYKEVYAAIYENIIRSVSLLDMIVVLVGILAGFFAISISSEYIERDRRDIAGILLLGIKRDDVVKAYKSITIKVVIVALILGCVLGILSSYLIMPFISNLDTSKYPFLLNYVISFEVLVPIKTILLLCIALVLSSLASLKLSLKKMIFSDIKAAI